MDAEQRQALKQKMRDRYSVHITRPQTGLPEEEPPKASDDEPDKPAPLPPPDKPDDDGQPDIRPGNQC